MTITKAVEAAREALKLYADDDFGARKSTDMAEKALSTLPEKPRTEEEINKIIQNQILLTGVDTGCIIRALRDAGVLYVAVQDEGEK